MEDRLLRSSLMMHCFEKAEADAAAAVDMAKFYPRLPLALILAMEQNG